MYTHRAVDDLNCIDLELERLELELGYCKGSSMGLGLKHTGTALGAAAIHYGGITPENLDKISWVAPFDVINFDEVVRRTEADARLNAYNLIKHLMMFSPANGPLKLATAESLTGGLIFSMLVDVPCGGEYKYGAFGVYDTEAKRTLLGVNAPDVYTHLCAHQMAVGVLRNSNATVAIAVTGNAMPLQGNKCNMDELKQLGEVFIGVAGYDVDGNIIVQTKVYNFCDEQYGGSNFAGAWYDTVMTESALAEQVESFRDTESGVMNKFQTLVNGYNPYICTSLLSRFIRSCTASQAFSDACKFVKAHGLQIPKHLIRTEAVSDFLKNAQGTCTSNNLLLNTNRSIALAGPPPSTITTRNVGKIEPYTDRSAHNGKHCLGKFARLNAP